MGKKWQKSSSESIWLQRYHDNGVPFRSREIIYRKPFNKSGKMFVKVDGILFQVEEEEGLLVVHVR